MFVWGFQWNQQLKTTTEIISKGSKIELKKKYFLGNIIESDIKGIDKSISKSFDC